jgi:transposase Tn5 family protein/transposase-like protein
LLARLERRTHFLGMFPLSAGELFFPGSLPDKRLQARAVVIFDAMIERPGAAMCAAFDDPKASRNAYNFFQNGRISLPMLLDPAIRAVSLALREQPEGATVLSVQDTTEINLSHLHTMQGLGSIGHASNRGLMLHAALALDAAGCPLGLLRAKSWARPPEQRGKAKDRRGRAFEDKESVRWWTTITSIEQTVRRPGLLLHVSDSESDIYELFAGAAAADYRLLIRAAHDRRVEGTHRLLWAQAESFAPQHNRRIIHVSARPATKRKPARQARQATVALRFGQVHIGAPHQAKGSVRMWAILVREIDPPAGQEPIEWLLLTTDAIGTEAEAWQHVDWYVARWVIEEYFKTLKSGCRIEERQFEARAPFEVSLGFSLLASVTLLSLTKRARTAPEQPAQTILSDDEQFVLKQRAKALRRPCSSSLTVQEAVVLIAMLGGYRARSCDGPPGWLTLWRGYQRLTALVEGYRLARDAQPDSYGNSAGFDAKE